MFDPMLDARVVEQRKQDMLRQARLHHIRREMLMNRGLIHRRWMALVADLMIASGTRLKARFEEKPAPAPRRPETVVADMGWERM
jgi:hypothetical protein